MDELITVKTSDFEADLVIAKSYLVDNGIDCVINSDYLTIDLPERGSSVLQVRAEDYNRAIELLIKGGFVRREDFE